MLRTVRCVALLGALAGSAEALQGGQYQPPEPEPGMPAVLEGVVSQPGLGPELVFTATAWEWWFDFHQEWLLELRERLSLRAAGAGATWSPVTDLDRSSLVVPALVAAARPKQPSSPGIQRDFNPRDVRAAAVLALGRLRSSSAVPYIESILEQDRDLFVRGQAILALGFSESSSAVETLRRLYQDSGESDEIRTYAAAGLGLIANSEALDTLAQALTEKSLLAQSNQLRAGTLYAAGLTGQPSLAVPLRSLADTFLYEREPSVRALVSAALGRVADPASAAFLLDRLSDPDNQARRSAAAALTALSAALDEPSVRRLLLHYEGESDLPTRLNLLRALGSARHSVSRAWLQSALPEATYAFRPHVAFGLVLDGDRSNIPALQQALSETSEPSHRAAYALTLALLEGTEAVGTLTEMLAEERSPYLRGYLALSLGLLAPGQSELAQQFETWAREAPNLELVRSSILALGLMGERARINRLAQDVGSLPGTLRRAAVLHGLGLVGDRTILLPLLAILRDEAQRSYVRTYALQALGELCDPRAMPPTGRLSLHVEMSHEVGFIFQLYQVL
ncbi:MAG: HEAT repeat domain-containing protein [Planctomycetota bacterium]